MTEKLNFWGYLARRKELAIEAWKVKHLSLAGTIVTGDRPTFRQFIGIIAVLGGLGGLAGLYVFEIPPGNREPLLLALGIVLGWGATVVGYEYGSSPAGRSAAAVGIRQAEAATPAPGAPDGSPQHPLSVAGPAPSADAPPVQTADAGDRR